ncbi:unnamed protein product, partial [Sphacelaria rigidula]
DALAGRPSFTRSHHDSNGFYVMPGVESRRDRAGAMFSGGSLGGRSAHHLLPYVPSPTAAAAAAVADEDDLLPAGRASCDPSIPSSAVLPGQPRTGGGTGRHERGRTDISRGYGAEIDHSYFRRGDFFAHPVAASLLLQHGDEDGGGTVNRYSGVGDGSLMSRSEQLRLNSLDLRYPSGVHRQERDYQRHRDNGPTDTTGMSDYYATSRARDFSDRGGGREDSRLGG